MERDLDLVRAILLKAAESPHANCGTPQVDGFTEEQIGYHVYLMGQAGLVEAIDVTTHGSNGPIALLNNITWAGHDYLDAVRDPKVYEHVKAAVKPIGTVSLDVIKQAAVAYTLKLVQSAMGI